MVLRSPDASQRPHSLDTGAVAEAAALLPSIHQEGYTAAHRLSRWALLITAESEYLCDSMTLDFHIHLRQLLFVALTKLQLNQTDGVGQIVIALQISDCSKNTEGNCTEMCNFFKFKMNIRLTSHL